MQLRFLIHLEILYLLQLFLFDFKFIAPLLAGFTRSNLFHFLVLFTFDCIYGALTYKDDSVPAKIATLVEFLFV
jgi:hypothetical protein